MAIIPNSSPGQMSGGEGTLNASAPSGSLNRYIDAANAAIRRDASGEIISGKHGRLNPEYFYTMQLLETIRLDADQYVYFRYADEIPIENKANRITLRRWTPLQAHTSPLVEGVPPVSDKAAAETYDILTMQYGRYMEFTDMVDIKLVDPVIANYAKEYSIVAIETLDMLARNALALVAQPYYAGFTATSFAGITTANAPSMNELRRIQLDMKRLLVKPRADKHFHVIAGPEFYFDMITDALVEKYMRFNKDTYTMYSDNALVPMFGMAFYETLAAPTSSVYYSGTGERSVRVMANSSAGLIFATAVLPTDAVIAAGGSGDNIGRYPPAGYHTDSRTGLSTSYDPNRFILSFSYDDSGANPTYVATALVNGIPAATGITGWKKADGTAVTLGPGDETAPTPVTTKMDGDSIRELKVAHVYVLGKDALVRTGIKGQGDAQVIVKSLGSSGVNDPLNQRQSIGFKINSVGFGNARAEAVSVYYCVPSALNL